ILSAGFTSDGLLRLRLSKAADLVLLRQDPSRLLLTSDADDTTVLPAAGILESDLESASTVTADFGLLEAGAYNLEMTYDVALPTLEYKKIPYEPREDKTPPTVERFYPERELIFADQADVQVVFSEPIDTTSLTTGTFILKDKSDAAAAFDRQWTDPFHLRLMPESLAEGQTYTLSITEFDVVDRAGNLLGDSLRSFFFSTMDPDSLGAVSGEIIIEYPDRRTKPVRLAFSQVGGRLTYNVKATEGNFSASLPAGKYLLTGFIDSNLNGEQDHGSIHPLALAETGAAHPDTIVVRARFETARIQFVFR
ncbi:MAG: Ig-like domain-containing protein, partial [Candidatus Zixiibacteriota bacterium]